ncbi:SseB family protein, partial [Micromonospora sp. 4G55]|uniref:SseB family protein n=1 Tax=Micromonospora sp. 4G55 TaxID=2806102 RepID=UPI001A645849
LLPVFTSADALTAFAGVGVPFVALSAADLLADWSPGRRPRTTCPATWGCSRRPGLRTAGGRTVADRDFPWTVVLGADRAPLLPVFTSADALTAFAGVGVPFVALSAADLLADWPDPGWGLAVDPGAAHGLTLTAPALAALIAANDLTDPQVPLAPATVEEPGSTGR